MAESSWEVTGSPHTSRCRSVDISPDGMYTITGGNDCKVKLWDSEGACVATADAPSGCWVTVACFSPDGTRALCAGDAGWVSPGVLSIPDMGTAASCTGGSDWIHGGHWMPDGETFVGGSDSSVIRVWRKDGGAPIRESPGFGLGWVHSVEVSPSGTEYCCGFGTSKLIIFSVETHEEIRRVDIPAEVRRARYSPDGSLIAVAHSSGLLVANASTGEIVQRSSDSRDIADVAFCDGGSKLVLGASSDPKLQIVDVATLEETGRLEVAEGVSRICYRTGVLAAALSNGRVKWFRGGVLGAPCEGGVPTRPLRPGEPPLHIRKTLMK